MRLPPALSGRNGVGASAYAADIRIKNAAIASAEADKFLSLFIPNFEPDGCEAFPDCEGLLMA